ncbi:MAG TPA: hypothetical protein VKD72_15445, partial [Gemmataceae bacterium]|nr:hypothetical protein [Gemmataceae bacterium]
MIASLTSIGHRALSHLPALLSKARKRARPVRWAAFVLVAGYLLFCHGCHGDEDHELFAVL